ncbi:hypothetical protein QBC46DRAFT_272160, partial [Diplogelasinospora grovesii]
YDAGAAANTQVPAYKAMGHTEVLPQVAMASRTSNFAVTPLTQKLTGTLDLRLPFLGPTCFFTVGAAVAGSAHNTTATVLGRITNGTGPAGTYQL